MKEFKQQSFEVKNAKSGHPVPVVNGVHLHSIYNPVKEARDMVKKSYKNFKENPSVLIFGYGFGYHIDEIISFFKSEKIKKYELVVIEPNEEILNEDNRPEKNIKVYCEKEPSELFKNIDFINFLIKKPVIFAHPPSFNLYKNYYEKLLKYKYPSDLVRTIKEIKNKSLKEFCQKNTTGKSLEGFLNNIKNKDSYFNKNEFLLMAFSSLINNIKKSDGEKNV